MIVAVTYTTIYNYICRYYLVMLQDKLGKHENKFENSKFKHLFGLGIPDILMNIMSCDGFSKSSQYQTLS